MFPLTVESKEYTFAVILMTTDAHVRGKIIEDLFDNPNPDTFTKANSLYRKLSKRTLEKYDKDAEV